MEVTALVEMNSYAGDTLERMARLEKIALVEMLYRWNCYADGSEAALVEMQYKWPC